MSSWEFLNLLYFVLPVCFFYTFKYLKMDQTECANQNKVNTYIETMNTTKEENEQLKKEIIGKDNTIKNMEKQLKDLDNKVNKLETFKHELTNRLSVETQNTKGMNEMMCNYENLVSKIIADRDLRFQEKQRAENHLKHLESAFKDLLDKYEQAKVVIMGLEQNEAALQNQVEMYKNVLDRMEDKYMEFKSYAIDKLKEANAHLEKNDREYMAETTKLKTKIIQSQYKINELEKSVSRNKLSSSLLKNGCSNGSIFEPLVTNFK